MLPGNIHFSWIRQPRAVETAVSLHSHTQHSKESLSFVPRYAYRIPLVADAVRRQERRYRACWGRDFDYERIYWTPPLPAKTAYALELGQIENQLDAAALVSITDHDDISAIAQLQLLNPKTKAPISVEWSVPFGQTFFHVGVHNLPAEDAVGWHQAMQAYRERPDVGYLLEILAPMAAIPQVLVVLNHPFWDEPGLGRNLHEETLHMLLRATGEHVHALELNGLRPWEENRQTIALAERYGKPVVSGGDRHGLEPSANVNLTKARTFSAFVEEVKSDCHSEVLFLQQYREPCALRCLETIWDVIQDYPAFPGRERWSDRVFYAAPGEEAKPVSSYLREDGPGVLRHFVNSVRFLRHPRFRPAMRMLVRQEGPA